MEEVILVDESDHVIGRMEKLEAHQKGALHRAFSVFIFNSKKQLLLQRRALTKYHSPGLWTNTCCSHPRPEEANADAAKRRLKEEMGMATELVYKTHFIYKTKFDNGLTEHEFDHIFVGTTDQEPIINPEEVEEYKWKSLQEIKSEIIKKPEDFTSWFKIAIDEIF